MQVTFPEYYNKTMTVEQRPRSIFDTNFAGQIDTNGEYYILYIDHKTHDKYAVHRDNDKAFRKIGRTLNDGEIDTFDGKRVRGMSFNEERLWDENRLMAHVDLWGNIAMDEEYDVEYHVNHV